MRAGLGRYPLKTDKGREKVEMSNQPKEHARKEGYQTFIANSAVPGMGESNGTGEPDNGEKTYPIKYGRKLEETKNPCFWGHETQVQERRNTKGKGFE